MTDRKAKRKNRLYIIVTIIIIAVTIGTIFVVKNNAGKETTADGSKKFVKVSIIPINGYDFLKPYALQIHGKGVPLTLDFFCRLL